MPAPRGYNPYMTQACRYDRLDGVTASDAAAGLCSRKALADPVPGPYSGDVYMDRQTAKQAAFLTMAPGGPNCRKGPPAMG
jgi:hemoglobin